MQEDLARITYLYHSGFAVETQDHLLVFDYYLDRADGPRHFKHGVITPEILRTKPSVIVFASHAHRDHFNPIVLKWKQTRPDIQFVAGSDVHVREKVHPLSPGQSLELYDARISAYQSTDAGVAFLVEVAGLSIFHAGDLNLWHWQEESTPEEVTAAKVDFLNALKPLSGKSIDIAFFPVDPRMGNAYDAGAVYFARTFKPKLFVPMHFGDRTDVCQSFEKRAKVPDMRVFNIERRGDQIEFNG